MAGDPDIVRVLAAVRLLSTAEGGKARFVRGSYRPNHNFFGPDNSMMTIGVMDIATEWYPGECREVVVTFLNWPGLAGQIVAGREWRIQEGPKLVGIGTVLRVLD
ncbi:hypothetical protein [Zavarzinia sp. CC-PAN008]|uniref:hypothetical protein n=1 Tax=Zavarzinia sp. CC-PAN008 TaxID=3243332 RepID=UPI003F748F06